MWLGNNLKVKDYQKFAQKFHFIREIMEVLQKWLDILVLELKEAKDEMIEQGIDPFALGDQVVKFFDGIM